MGRGRAEPTRAQYSHGLEYVANKPAFLANFGRPAAAAGPSSRSSPGREGRDGREPLPERPDEGEWAKGSDDESEEDEWDTRFGGGEDGPQVVVLKEGRHLSAAEVERERLIGTLWPLPWTGVALTSSEGHRPGRRGEGCRRKGAREGT